MSEPRDDGWIECDSTSPDPEQVSAARNSVPRRARSLCRRLRTSHFHDEDVYALVLLTEELVKRVLELEPAAAALKAAEDAYHDPSHTKTEQRQAAACRKLGLTKEKVRGRRDDPAEILQRWYAHVVRCKGDGQQALEALADELGIEPNSAEKKLRDYKAAMQKLVDAGATYADELRLYLEALSEGPAKIPSTRGR